MATSLSPNIPIGDLQFYDNDVPALAAGNWHITVSHTLDGVDTGSLGATQELVVSAPQFSMDPTAMLNQYPPAGSTGQYAQVLPHIVLNDALLPWERAMTGSSNTQPWLALLVLQDDELLAGTDSPTRTQISTVAGFLAADPAVLKPAVTKEDDVTDTDPCTFIQIPTAVFPALTPRLEELRFLAHCRQSNIADKAEQGLEQNGLFSVVVGNRFPALPGAGGGTAQKNIAHLVSLEGLEPYLVDQPSFGNSTSVALISLASWTFNATPDQLQDFRGLMEQLVSQEYDGSTYTPGNLWLRLPATGIDTSTPAGAETSRRIQDGFVPLQYQLRTGEQTFAWYRGPCAPVLTTPLSWTLPDALRHSGADLAAGEYPLVPNRWLIVRMNGSGQRQATAWVLESDCPFTSVVTTADSANTSMYLADPGLINLWKSSTDPIRSATTLNPAPAAVQVAKIGVSFPLAQWSERAAQIVFLSAVAPSNPLFSSYLAHNLGVFSFYDDLDGIDSDTLSYFVLGWFSDPSKDILAPAGTDDHAYANLLGQLRWALAGGSQSATDQSVYHGAAFSIGWNRTGAAPADDPLQNIRDSGKLNVGVGNTTIDAFTALIGQQLGDPVKAELLRAFQYDFLQQLNEINGEALLEAQIRQAWFGSTAGGYSWTIVENSSDGTTGTTLTPTEQNWLFELNRAQAALDAALTTLYSLQWELHALWLKNGYLSDQANTFPQPPSGVGSLSQFRDQLATQLNPAQSGSPAAKLVAQFGIVQQLLPQVPQPDCTGTQNAQQALQNGIGAFAKAKQLDPSKTLKAAAAPRYWQANNPVVIVSGVDAPPSAVSRNLLPVRPADDLVTGFTVGGAAITAGAVAGLVTLVSNLSAVPSAAAQPLLQEFLLLDPANAAAIAAAAGRPAAQVAAVMSAHDSSAYQGTLPQITLAGWRQPWSPMFLEWSGTYSYIPFEVGSTPSWTFNGTDYRLTAVPSTLPTEQRAIGGISLLSPHPSFVFGSRLDKFVQQYGSATELAQIDEWIAGVYHWQFLAQELTGFNQLLSLRDTRAFRRPTAADQIGGYPVAALTGYGDGAIPAQLALPPANQGQVNSVPFFPNGAALPFHGARQGDYYFTDFFLYDKFGRTLFVIESSQSSGLFDYTNFPVQIDQALAPDEVIVPKVNSVLQLAPRLLQHARLDIRLLDAIDDGKVFETDPDVVPISGWVLPNHLSGSILVFAPDGAALGEFRLFVQADGSKLGQWWPPPHSTLTFDDVGTAAPHLRAMLDSPQLQQEAGFQAFLAAIDETLWTTDPLGNRVDQNLSVLVGRPLALLRTRLQFQLDGDPIGDTGWAATFTNPAPDFLSFNFSIRLGDQLTRQDGVIGYFTGSDYNVFNSTVAPRAGPPQTYVNVIGPVGNTSAGNYLQLSFRPDTYQYVTVLADPRAAMHAYTGILPVKQCDIPQQFVDSALSAMEISFQLGPLLTVLGPSPTQGNAAPPYPESIVYPTPAEQNGSWSWWEKTAAGNAWTGYGLVRASEDAQSTSTPSSLREGYLQFITNLGK